MTNPKGTRFETLVADYLNEGGLSAKRTGNDENALSDLHFGVFIADGEWTVECKDQADIDLPGFLRQLAASVERRGDVVPFKAATVIKNRRHGVGDAYAVMSLERYRQLAMYVMLLEETVGNLTGKWVAIPDQTRKFLSYMAASSDPSAVPFAEFRTAEGDAEYAEAAEMDSRLREAAARLGEMIFSPDEAAPAEEPADNCPLGPGCPVCAAVTGGEGSIIIDE